MSKEKHIQKRKETELVTLDRLLAGDHYRAQVNLEGSGPNGTDISDGKLIWAVGYGPIADHDATSAKQLRDAYACAIVDLTFARVNRALEDPFFMMSYQSWLNNKVIGKAKPIVLSFLRRRFPQHNWNNIL